MKVWPSQNNLLGPKIPRVVSFHWCIGLGSWKQSQLFNLEKTNQQHHVVIVLQHTWLALGKVGRHEGGNWRADAYAFAFLVLQTHTHTQNPTNIIPLPLSIWTYLNKGCFGKTEDSCGQFPPKLWYHVLWLWCWRRSEHAGSYGVDHTVIIQLGTTDLMSHMVLHKYII